MKLFDNFLKRIIKLVPKNYKKKSELNYWINLVKELTQDCKSLIEKEEKLLSICYKVAHPRYKKDLYLEDDSLKGKRVLDLGCGPHGGLIGFKDCDKYGIDHLIEEYKKIGYPLDKHGIKYYSAKSENMPFPSFYFDVVICVNALDHVDSLDKTVKEIGRVLKRNGKFISQINFHDKQTITEPIILNHRMLELTLQKNNLFLVKRIFQYHINKENRYYYECKKI